MITRITIEKRKEFVVGGRIDDLVNTRQAEGVLRAVFVGIGVINTHPPFFILLWYKDWISQPLRMIHLFNKNRLLRAVLFLP